LLYNIIWRKEDTKLKIVVINYIILVMIIYTVTYHSKEYGVYTPPT